MFCCLSVHTRQHPFYSTIVSHRWSSPVGSLSCPRDCGHPSWERQTLWDKQCHSSRSLFILVIKSSCPLDEREFSTYSTAPVGYVDFHFDGKLFSHLDKTFLKRGHACALSNSLWRVVSPEPERILTLGLCCRRLWGSGKFPSSWSHCL